ncbi:asparagine synthase (glutamine-hydrolyzing) [Rhizobium sp.]
MCGIAGYFGQVSDATSLLAGMSDSIAHRGPDGSGASIFAGAGLAHRRLAIVDLAQGAQPMASADGRLTISFNGEIFNHVELRQHLQAKGHVFRTLSDTEVILHLYADLGEGCLDHLNGDFAFAIWDNERRRMFLARDRMGVRPLYHARHHGTVYFASEAKALLTIPGFSSRLDIRALDQIFTLWAPIAPRTAFEGVSELEPASYAIIDDDGFRSARYWQPAYPDRTERPSERSEEELHALLTDAVRLRMRADVPVGCYLSGGLDSSAVAALAAPMAPMGLRTYAIGFDSTEHDESRFQSVMAAHLGTRHAQTRIGAGDIARDFGQVIAHAERPIIRTAPTPLYALAKAVRADGVKAVLTGEGADEIFAGYDIFKEAKVRRFCARQPGSRFRTALFGRLYPYLPGLARQTPATLAAYFGAGAQDLDDPLFSHRPRFRSTSAAKIVFSKALKSALGDYDAAEEMASLLPADFGRWHTLNQAQYLETRFLLPGYILSSQGDRMAMAHGVEGRFPFLDHRIVEFANALPVSQKLRGLEEKHLLRRMARGLLPAEIVDRPKQPYRAPDSEAFAGTQGQIHAQAVLAPDAIGASGLFDPVAVGHLNRKCAAGKAAGFRDNAAFVGVLSTELWQQAFALNSTRKAVA